MYKIRRVNITDVYLLCRCYGSQRNRPNHYETLCIQNNSSQKEIREAFLKLSKKLHPDIANKGSHAEFVKLNEAYKILSKDNSRREHDNELKYQSAMAQNGQGQYSGRVFYNEYVDFKSRTNQTDPEFEKNYYGIKGIKRISNGKIAALCIIVCIFIVCLEITALHRYIKKSQDYMKRRSLEAEEAWEEARSAAHSMTRAEQIQAMQKRFDARNEQQKLEENTR